MDRTDDRLADRRGTAVSGQSLTEYALLLGLVAAVAALSLAALGPATGNIYRQVVDALQGQLLDEIIVRVVDGDDQPQAGIYVYQFTGDGTFTDEYGLSDENGEIFFSAVNAGESYQYLAYDRNMQEGAQFWSATIRYPQQNSTLIRTALNIIEVNVLKSNGRPLKNVPVYAMTANGRYPAGAYGSTDKQGQVRLTVADGEYKFRVYYHGKYFWSDTVSVPAQASVTIDTQTDQFTIDVVDGYGNSLKGVRVYVYTTNDAYIGVSGYSDKNGRITVNLASGTYKLRGDYYGRVYWSDPVDSGATNSATFAITP